jgi:cation diffusion facilitator CzcD-associated flavoprotein CzcO
MSISKTIRSVAVIGAGPAGIACVNELAHVAKSGISTLEQNIKPSAKNAAFNKIVCFEQNDKIGGVWNFFAKPDPKMPSIDILKSKRFNTPDGIFEYSHLPSDSTLKETSSTTPFVRFSNKTFEDELKWNKNAAYKDLFTNIPEKFMKFSYTPYKGVSKGRFLEPLVSLGDVKEYLDSIVEKYSLSHYFRTSSSVELVEKDDNTNKWTLTIRKKPRFSKIEQWYREEFDAVVVANGHCNVPFIPKTDGLTEFVAKYPDVVRHSKSFRDPAEFENKSVLLCGSGTSSADLAQYLAPVARSVTISQRSKTVYGWIEECFQCSPAVKFKPRIKRYITDNSEKPHTVEFDDGSFAQFDHIILSTGYHYHFPFLPKSKEYIKIYNDAHDCHNPINKIGNLFLYTFSIKDNTLATVGIPTIGLMFHAMEYSAAAIAGIFSASKRLPPIGEQTKWDDGRTKVEKPEVPQRFQGFFTDKLEEQLLNPLFAFAPDGRTTPLVRENVAATDVESSNPALIRAYKALMSGKYSSKDLLE